MVYCMFSLLSALLRLELVFCVYISTKASCVRAKAFLQSTMPFTRGLLVGASGPPAFVDLQRVKVFALPEKGAQHCLPVRLSVLRVRRKRK